MIKKKKLQNFQGCFKRKSFGFAQVDIEVPDKLCDKFSEISPLFVVQGIPDCAIPEEMIKGNRQGKNWKKKQ